MQHFEVRHGVENCHILYCTSTCVVPQHGMTSDQFSSNMSDSDEDKEVRGEMGKEMTLSNDAIVARVM